MLQRKCRANSKQLNLLWHQEGVETEFSQTSAMDLRPSIKSIRYRIEMSISGSLDSGSRLELRSCHKWQQWSSEAEGLSEIKIPQYYLGDLSNVEVHYFSGVSKSASMEQYYTWALLLIIMKSK
ncbi:uncharacterized protein TNIN_52311 [Trichonephila inaurata madagascariensis]|uniref:Uncharacterized protein n=1 Tax=Trichonephila inaurata madagascariensis TaxID=2747483 RepID=A0A8X6IAE5_9ARAC|nr:uncharacterized protein TNIN_52311 [Trichonephila inaurata madagascariensis]